MNQKATVKDGSISLQAGSDMNFNLGLSFENCERFFDILFKANFPKLEIAAAQAAEENVSKLVSSTFKKLEERIELLELSKLAEPDVQHTFNTATQAAAKKGNKIDLDLLSELLQSRLEKENDDYIDQCIEAAVEVIPKLTNELLSALAVIHFVQNLTIDNINELEGLATAMQTRFLNTCNNISLSKLSMIAGTGAGSYANVMGSNTFKEYFDRRYPNITIKDENKFPNLSRFLNGYDRLSLHKLSLNTVGQVIALKMLNKIFGNLPLKSCLV